MESLFSKRRLQLAINLCILADDIMLCIRYCMPWTRHILQSVAIPAVTQVRVSDDYQPSNTQWRIGDTTILAHAMGLAAFKDVCKFYYDLGLKIAKLVHVCEELEASLIPRPLPIFQCYTQKNKNWDPEWPGDRATVLLACSVCLMEWD